MSNQASESGAEGGGYEIGDLDLGGAAPATSPAAAKKSLSQREPANDQGRASQAKPAGAERPGAGPVAAFGELEADDDAGPALELDLGTSHARPSPPGAARTPATEAKKPGHQLPEALSFGNKSFDEDEVDAGPALEIENVKAKAEEVRSPARDAKQDAVSEHKAAIALGAFGAPPSDLLGSARYALFVFKRLRALKRGRKEAAGELERLEGELHLVYVAMGEAIMEKRSDPQATSLRTQMAQVIDARAKSAEADVSMDKTRTEAQRMDAELAKEIAELARAIEPFVAAEQTALDEHKKAEDALRRAQGMQQRAEIELRSATAPNTSQPPLRSEDLKRVLEERRAQGAELSAAAERTKAALNQARRELALKKAEQDAAEDRRKKLQGDAQKRESEAQKRALAASDQLRGALRTLAETCIQQDLAKKLVPDSLQRMREVGATVLTARKQVARYDTALTLYDRSSVTKGWGLIGVAALIIVTGLIMLTS